MDEDRRPSEPSIGEVIQALRARAGFETLFPEGTSRKENLIHFVARLRGDYPDAYDVFGTAAYLEQGNRLRATALSVLRGTADGDPAAHPFSWDEVLKHPVLRGLEDLTVSMRGGKGRREGVEISKTAPLVDSRSRWSWRRGAE